MPDGVTSQPDPRRPARLNAERKVRRGLQIMTKLGMPPRTFNLPTALIEAIGNRPEYALVSAAIEEAYLIGVTDCYEHQFKNLLKGRATHDDMVSE